MSTTEKTAAQHAADAAVSHGDALAAAAEGHARDAQRSATECRERVALCHAAAASEGGREGRAAALQAAGLLMTLPAPPPATATTVGRTGRNKLGVWCEAPIPPDGAGWRMIGSALDVEAGTVAWFWARGAEVAS